MLCSFVTVNAFTALPARRLRGLALAALLAWPGAPALAADTDGQSTMAQAGAWNGTLRAYASKLLNSNSALSMAALPMNGPGVEQFINADALMSPGSIMKVLTTYAALELLGPNHTWDTDFLTFGDLSDSTLNGNLYVRFGGDPKLTYERLWSTLRELRDIGITRINGDLILDGSYFQIDGGFPPFHDSGSNPHAPFLVQPSAYLTNLNLSQLEVRSDERGTRAWSTPNLAEVVINNQVVASAEGPCPGRDSFIWTPVFHSDQSVTVSVKGTLPKGCRTTRYLSLQSHERYSASMIRSLLAEMGVQISGVNRVGPTPENARRVMRTTSPDLVTMVRDINKWSSNVMARQLLLSIGAEKRTAADNDDRVTGIRAIYSWLESKGLNTTGMVIDNGAGLTRHGRISARQGADILRDAWNSRYSADLMASMPLIAMDGTMARRLRNAGMKGEGRIKTGYLEKVRSIAGFTRDQNNTTWAVVGMVNHDPAWNGQAVLDRILYSLRHKPPVPTTLSQSAGQSGNRIRR